MMSETIIKLDSVSKCYRIGQYAYSTFRENVYDLFGRLLKRNKSDSDIDQELWALKDVSFEVRRGEAIGIIGPNGAGKTTILKIFAGVTAPTKGEISIKGKIAAMIELSAGFHGELTGRENIYLNASIMGMRKEEIRKKFDSIVDFSELSQFIDTPLKRYSSGMRARLGFAVAIHTEPDILLIDEVLSVGDIAFQNKCLAKMEEYRKKDTTIIFVSHNLDSVRKLCPQTILLDHGQIKAHVQTEEAINEYYKVISNRSVTVKSADGTKKAEIVDIQLMNGDNIPSFNFKTGDKAKLIIKAKFYEDSNPPLFGFFIRRIDGLIVMDTNSKFLKVDSPYGKKGAEYIITFNFEMNLLKGTYQIGSHILVVNGTRRDFYDHLDNALTFNVKDEYAFAGIADLKPECNIQIGK